MDEPRTIVIGGGLAGLTAAATVARTGRTVTLLEGGEHLGGRARSRRRDGFHVNLGPHALYRRGGGLAVLRRLGVSVRGRRPRLDRAGVYVDGIVVPAFGYLRHEVRDRLRVARAMAGLGDGDAASWAGRPAQEWIDDVTDDPAGRAMLASVVRTATYTADHDLLDAGAAATQLRAAAHGVLYLHGGWSSLVDGLADVLRDHDGTVETKATVTGVEHGDDAVHAVWLSDGRMMAADAVVIAVNDPGRVARLLGGEAARRVEAAATAAVPVRMAHLDVALRPLPERRFPNVLGVDEPVFISVQSSVADVAPPGGAVINVGRYLRPGEEGGDHRGSLERVLDVAQPDWRDHVVDARYVPRSMVAGDHPRAATGGASGRPRVDVTGVRGLAVAGDWIGPDGVLADASILSGAAAAERVMATEPELSYA
ncbi:MAG: phytoene desaturase family protein [Ilumatobacteraceae bacterium]